MFKFQSVHFSICSYLASHYSSTTSDKSFSVEETASTASTTPIPSPPALDTHQQSRPATSSELSSKLKVITPLQSLRGGSSPPSLNSLGGSCTLQVKPWAKSGLGDAYGEESKDRVEEGSLGKTSTRVVKEDGYVTSSSIPGFGKKTTFSERSGYQLYPLNSTSPSQSQSPSSVGAKSSVTTASEIDFRNNLATLDADIARLQMQFKVALQSPMWLPYLALIWKKIA